MEKGEKGLSKVTVPSVKVDVDDDEPNAEEKASCLSRWLLVWVGSLMALASRKRKREKKELEFEDLFKLPKQDDTDRLYQKFNKEWDRRQKVDEVAELSVKEAESMLWGSLFHVIRRKMIFATFVKFTNSTVQFSYPILLSLILASIEDFVNPPDERERPVWNGYVFALSLSVAMLLKAILETNYFFLVQRCGWQVRSTVATAVYQKSLRLSASARQQLSLGQIVNLMQIDSTKLEQFVSQAVFLLDGAYQIVGYVAIAYYYIGWSAFVGVAVMILAMPIQVIVMFKLTKLNRAMALKTDERVKLSNEGMQGMLAVKMAAWETKLTEAIGYQRKKEVGFLGRMVYLNAFSSSYMMSVPAIVAVAALSVYAGIQDGEISASILFAALSAFGQLRFPLMFYPMTLASYAQATVSVSRVAAYLSMGELQHDKLLQAPTTPSKGEADNATPEGSVKKIAIEVKNGSFYWEKPGTKEKVSYFLTKGKSKSKKDVKKKEGGKDTKKALVENLSSATTVDVETGQGSTVDGTVPILEGINISIEAGSLTAIIGPVGSGKSSLINAILGEMYTEKGEVFVDGTVALATQSAWIANDTIRNNILFGEKYDEDRYIKVIRAAQLSHDFQIFEDGDQTMIGERGINLSGGQKQRISVARAAYSSKEIIILDDPLSALDPGVSQSLFTECILGFMANKTRVLVTNQINVLPLCDDIIVLKDACVVESGTYDKLMADQGAFAKLLEEYMGEENSSESDDDVGKNKTTKSKSGLNLQTSGKELIEKEERNVGAVRTSVYSGYIKNGGGYLLFSFDLLLFCVSMFFMVFSSAWISIWSNDPNYETNTITFYLVGYALIAVFLAVSTFLRQALLMYIGVRASRSLHEGVLKSIIHAPMSFFDTTPLGRVLSRFSKDLYSVDLLVPQFFSFFLFTIFFVIFSLATIVFATPIFAVAIPFFVVIYFLILGYYRPVARDVKRLEAISRSPVYAHFSETLGGLGTIRAFQRVKVFEVENAAKMNFNIQVWYCVKAAERWLAVRLELLGASITLIAAMLAVSQSEQGNISAGLAGLSLVFSMSVTNLLGQTVRSFAELEAGMNCVERILHYSNNIPQEKDYITDEPVPSNWPDNGSITFSDLKMRYRADTNLVLKGLNFAVNGGERIGVVGRTGSGKSSLFLTLLRLVEPQGTITIDGIDIGKIGIHTLRSRISIVPQNPVIFSGTVRSNLDPFNEYSDEQIEKALERCSLKDHIASLPKKLLNEVSEGGENFSQGQRQLLCLSRALLRNAKILMLDEATSSVDFETDALIQKTIRGAFKGCTILTIAHRLSSVLDNDKILVLDNGEVSEYGKPSELLKNKDGKLYEMVYALGEDAAAKLMSGIVEAS